MLDDLRKMETGQPNPLHPCASAGEKSAAMVVGMLGAFYLVTYVVLCVLRELQPFALLNLLLSAGVVVICAPAMIRRQSDAVGGRGITRFNE